MFKVSIIAIVSFSALAGFADTAKIHPPEAHLKQDGGVAAADNEKASQPADNPRRILRKGLNDFTFVGGGNKPNRDDSPQDVSAQIVGGEDVDPPRKYKVRGLAVMMLCRLSCVY